MTQEAGPIQTKSARLLAGQWVICVLAYALVWGDTFSLLWFLESNGLEVCRHLDDPWRVLLMMAYNALCPDWPFLVAGLCLGVLTCLCIPKAGGAVKSGLLWSLLPVAAILTMFGFTASGLLPALLAIAASWLAASVVARTWQQPLFSVPFVGRPLAPRGVIICLAWLLALSVPFRLFDLVVAAWAQAWGADISDTGATVSPDGAYIAVIHNVNPGAVGDYSDVTIRPRHAILNLFSTSSASSRYFEVGHIRWSSRHTLSIWRSYDAGQEQWHDVRIIYKDTRGAEEKKQDDPMRGPLQ